MSKKEQIGRKYNVAPNPIAGVFARYANMARNVGQVSLGPMGTGDSASTYMAGLIDAKKRMAALEHRVTQQKTTSAAKLQGLEREIQADRDRLAGNLGMARLEADKEASKLGVIGTVAAAGAAMNQVHDNLRQVTHDLGDESNPTAKQKQGTVLKVLDKVAGGMEWLNPALKEQRKAVVNAARKYDGAQARLEGMVKWAEEAGVEMNGMLQDHIDDMRSTMETLVDTMDPATYSQLMASMSNFYELVVTDLKIRGQNVTPGSGVGGPYTGPPLPDQGPLVGPPAPENNSGHELTDRLLSEMFAGESYGGSFNAAHGGTRRGRNGEAEILYSTQDTATTYGKSLEDMTIAEVREAGKRKIGDRKRLAFVGRAQWGVTSGAFEEAVRAAGLKPTDKVNEANQRKMEQAYVEGMPEYKAFRRNPSEANKKKLLDKMATIWRSIETAEGDTHQDHARDWNRAVPGSRLSIGRILDELAKMP